MLYRGVLVLALGLAACQFRPEGLGAADDDDDVGDATELDAPTTTIDAPAPTIDAPMVTVDAAIDARPPCPTEYDTVYSGVRYVRRGPASIDTARADCGDDLAGRTRLASFPVPGTMEGVLDQLIDDDQSPWVGARCEFGTFGCAGAASWKWDTGEGIEATMWAQFEPNNAFTELNAAAVRRSGDWELMSVDGVFPFEGRRYVCACVD